MRFAIRGVELFTLAFASAHLPETRRRITHLRAGLRALLFTITNVVEVYIRNLRGKGDSGYGPRLIRTVRGTGYQIGTNG